MSLSVKTLAWLGDAAFDVEVRATIVAAGDFLPDVLHKVKAKVVGAPSQSEIFAVIAPQLSMEEQSLARRAHNSASGGHKRTDNAMREYRVATALEALVGLWLCCEPRQSQRFHQLVLPEIRRQVVAILVSYNLPVALDTKH